MKENKHTKKKFTPVLFILNDYQITTSLQIYPAHVALYSNHLHRTDHPTFVKTLSDRGFVQDRDYYEREYGGSDIIVFRLTDDAKMNEDIMLAIDAVVRLSDKCEEEFNKRRESVEKVRAKLQIELRVLIDRIENRDMSNSKV